MLALGFGFDALQRRRSGPVVYTPRSVSPHIWLKMSDPTGMFQTGSHGSEGAAVALNDDPVGLMHDFSGANRDFAQTLTSRPFFKTSGPMVEFDGVDDFLENLAPGLGAGGYPFTVGCRFNSNTTPFSTMFSYCDTSGATTHRLAGFIDGSGKVGIEGRDGTSKSSVTAKSISHNVDNYGIWRYISATNRRLSVYFADSTIEHIQNVTSATPAGLDAFRIGCGRTLAGAVLDPFKGRFSNDFWVVNADIQPDGLQLADATLLQIVNAGIAL